MANEERLFATTTRESKDGAFIGAKVNKTQASIVVHIDTAIEAFKKRAEEYPGTCKFRLPPSRLLFKENFELRTSWRSRYWSTEVLHATYTLCKNRLC